mgnify:CR=1 FL=1
MSAKPCPFCGLIDDHTDDCYFTLKLTGATIGQLQEAWDRRAAPDRRPMPPEMKAAIEEAHKTDATSAVTTSSGAVFINYGHDYGDNAHLECTACGGSGHIEDQKQRAAPVSGEPFAWMKPNEIEGLLKAASQDGETRHYGRIYARQYDPDMVPVSGPLASTVDPGNV